MTTRPNSLLTTTDQQRFDTIGALGNPCIFTPHLDWLVDEGVSLTRCYSDSPICMSARATVMTGKHGHTTGLVGNSADVTPLACNPTRAQGKMHFHPMRANYGFEHMELPMDYCRERHRDAPSGLPKEHGIGENEIAPVISAVAELLAAMRAKVVDHLTSRNSPLVKDGQLVAGDAPTGPRHVRRWPGFHSTVVPSDVLH
jgi:hypothetical protein